MCDPQKNRTAEDQKQCQKIYDNYRNEILTRQLSNSENYDKMIITLSSAGLGLSLTLLQLVVPLETADYLWLIEISWVLFSITILCTLCAYGIGNRALSKQLSIAENYYIEASEEAWKTKNEFATWNTWLNKAMGIFFIGAILCLVSFMIINLHGENQMGDKKPKKIELPKTMSFTDSSAIPTMQQVPRVQAKPGASANIPSMQMAPNSTKPSPSKHEAAPSPKVTEK